MLGDSLVGDLSEMRERSSSYYDVLAVEGGQTLPAEIQRRNVSQADKTAYQMHENDPAEVVLVCEPEGASLMMGGLHPRASLYDRPVNLDISKRQHKRFREVLRSHGLKVLTVREVLAFGAEEHVGARISLEDLAMMALNYRIAEGFQLEELSKCEQYYLSDEYKRRVLEGMSVYQLIEVVLVNPTVWLAPSDRDTGLTSTYEFQPLSNLVYMRDQQITTAKGIVMGKLRSSQRHLEVDLMKFCIRKLGFPVIGEISEPGFLEGGDFFPAGRDLCFIGVGLRSNEEACKQLMDNDWLGTKRVAIVFDKFEKHQDRMHLDCVFNIVGNKCCILLEELIGDDAPTKRLVDEYTRNSVAGNYQLTRQGIEFNQFLKEEGYKIIPITAEDQLQYACNVLNLGNGKLISVHTKSARQLIRFPHFSGTVQVVDFSSITSMYGAVHCCTQVLRRHAKSRLGWPRRGGISSHRMSDSSILDAPRSEPHSDDESGTSIPENGVFA